MKTSQISLLDLILRDPRFNVKRPDQNAARTLFTIWKDQNNKSGSNRFHRPTNIALSEVEAMISDGLIRQIGEQLEVTKKGSDVLKTMILGDDRSSFEDDGSVLPYRQAKQNTIPGGGKKKVASASLAPVTWWQKLSSPMTKEASSEGHWIDERRNNLLEKMSLRRGDGEFWEKRNKMQEEARQKYLAANPTLTADAKNAIEHGHGQYYGTCGHRICGCRCGDGGRYEMPIPCVECEQK